MTNVPRVLEVTTISEPYGTHPTRQTALINGVRYTRTGGGAYGPLEQAFWANEEADPAIVCVCGGTLFIITYGSFECFARCAACGITGSIYSG